jgi:prepilin-type N-terminal cleavage/methylation domain-containing protein
MTRAREAGFTLIEILVALGLAALILVGTLGFVNAQSRTQRDSMELQTMQMGLRAGLERILRDTRSASAGFNIGTINVQDRDVYTAIGGTLASGSLPAVWMGTNPQQNQTNTGPYAACQSFTCSTTTGSDELNLIFADGRGITNTTKDLSGIITQTTVSAVTVMDVRGFVGAAKYPDNFVIISDVSNTASAGANGVLAKVSAVAMAAPGPGGSITLAPMAVGLNAFPVTSFQGGSLIMTASAVRYRIDPTFFGTNKEPALVMVRGAPLGINTTPDPLATQVEDLQVALGFDGLGGGLVDNFITEDITTGANADEYAFNVVGDSLWGPIANLRQVRVTLVARSVNPRAVGVAASSVEDHVPSGSTDTYLRRRLTGVASVRNLAF